MVIMDKLEEPQLGTLGKKISLMDREKTKPYSIVLENIDVWNSKHNKIVNKEQ